MIKIISLIMGLITALSLASEGIKYGFSPTLEIDAAISKGNISTRASGFLYGLAESGVPDPAIVESIDIASVSQKVIDGLQHPVGDIDNVADNLKNCDYTVVYLQDCFDTWYYCHQEIAHMRANGTYDCEKFVDERFLPSVIESVTKLSSKDYSDKIVYCPYNECDNTVWFGTPQNNGEWYAFDDEAKLNFYNAWKKTFNLIRSINPDALIGGPGYCDYDKYEIEHFLKYCKENNCLPDIMIYHELGITSALWWQDHIDEYREIEKSLGINELPIIITEYGTMEECGNPADMLQYIVNIEKSGAYANMAFWRLANNLCDTAADNNSPNSNWWLFRWYADMEGNLLKSKIIDIPHSDFANVIKYNRDKFHYSQLTGMASITESKDKIEILCGGCDYTSDIIIKNINKSLIGKKADIKIECVYYEGLSGIVNEPITVKEYTENVSFDRLKIELDNPDPTAVYHIVVTPDNGEEECFENNSLPVRYEFEKGTLNGTAYTYDSAYATTGLVSGMVGGFEHEGDGVTLEFNAPESGEYELDIIFGNSNDGTKPDDRKDSHALLTLDGETETISFPNTIKSEYTDKYIKIVYLEKGTHTLTLAHKQGTFVVDSLLLKPFESKEEITVLPDADRTNSGIRSFLAVAPYDGYYNVNIGINAEFTVDGACGKINNESPVYLRRGLNYIDIKTNEDIDCVITKTKSTAYSVTVNPQDMTLSDGAVITENYIDGISSNGGKAEFSVNAPEAGSYRMTVLYSNNDEGGIHSYNVDLIERYITVNCNGEIRNLWCRNTYSWDTFKTVTADIVLEKGENIITFTNDGSENFNDRETFAPHISTVTINKTVAD